MSKIQGDELNCLLLLFESYGYKVSEEELLKFLDGKEISDEERIKLAKKRLDDYELIYQQEQKRKMIDEANKPDKVQVVKDTLKIKFKEYGYELTEDEFEFGFNKLTKENIYGLYRAIIYKENFTIKFSSYEFNELFFEEFFSQVDFFSLKENKVYDEIIKRSGTLYFRVPKHKSSLGINNNNKRYTSIYEIVEYDGMKYVIKRSHGNSMIVNIPDKIIKEEFKNIDEYLSTFEKVGMLGYKKGVYDKESLAEFYISYKNDDMVIAKVKYPNRTFLSSIYPGEVYTDDNWEYEKPKNKKYSDVSLEDAISEIIYGQKTED